MRRRIFFLVWKIPLFGLRKDEYVQTRSSNAEGGVPCSDKEKKRCRFPIKQISPDLQSVCCTFLFYFVSPLVFSNCSNSQRRKFRFPHSELSPSCEAILHLEIRPFYEVSTGAIYGLGAFFEIRIAPWGKIEIELCTFWVVVVGLYVVGCCSHAISSTTFQRPC